MVGLNIIEFIDIDENAITGMDSFTLEDMEKTNVALKEYLKKKGILKNKAEQIYSVLSIDPFKETEDLIYDDIRGITELGGFFYCKHIEIKEFERLLFEEYREYKEKHPYCNEKDFVNHNKYFIEYLNDFCELDSYGNIGRSDNFELSTIRAIRTFDKTPFLIYGVFVETNHSLDFYKQYYREVLKLFNEFSEGQTYTKSELNNNSGLRQGYDNLLFDQFIYGASLDNKNLLKPEVVNIWFEHTENEYERAMFRAYNNIDYVMFLNTIDLDVINGVIVDLWNIYKTKYIYSSKEDYIKSVWQFSIYEIEDFIKETYYHSGYNCKGFELWFCNDKNDITNNLWFFLDEDKDPDYYKQYFKKVLELLISFKGVNSNDNTNEPPPEATAPFNTKNQKDIFEYLSNNWVYKKPVRYAYIYKFMTDEINLKIDFTTYNKFIISKYGKKVQRNNASRGNNYEQLRELMEEYDN